MNLITHLLKKDIRRARVLLVVWMLLLVLRGILVGAGGHPADRLMQALYSMIEVLVPLSETLLLFVIVPFVVQEEPLVGTTGFWLTRPVSGADLLKAKALFALVVLMLAPLVVELVVLAANGVTSGHMALAVPEILLRRLEFILPMAVVAALTPTFGRYAIAGVTLVVAGSIASMVWQWMRLYLHPDAFMAAQTDISVTRSGAVATGVVAIILGGAILAHQYLTRNSVRSIAAAGVGVIAVCAVGNLWSWDFLAPRLSRNAPPFDVAKVQLNLNSAYVNDINLMQGTGEPQKQIQGNLDTVGIPGRYVLRTKRVRAQLKLPDGRMLPVKNGGESGVAMSRTEPYDAALGTPVVNASGSAMYNTSLAILDAQTYHQFRDEPLTFTADIDILASQYVVTAVLPVARGARYDHGSDHLVITDVLHVTEGVDIVVRERKPDLMLDPQTNDVDPRLSFNQGTACYFLRNKKRNEAVLQKHDFGNNISIGLGFTPMLVSRPLRLSFGPEPNYNNLTPELTPEWLADAELVRLELQPVCVFSKSLMMEKFRLNGRNPVKSYGTVVKPDLEALGKIVLPENPSKQQVREYIRTVLLSAQRQNIYLGNRDDPYVAKLAAVGAENLDVLLVIRSETGSYLTREYLDSVINQLARPADKDLILGALPAEHELAEIVVAQGWQAEARETLVAALARRERSLPRPWIGAVASLRDPVTYDDLKDYFVNGSDRSSTFAAIRNLPGIDLREAVGEAWKKAKFRSFEASDMLKIAAEFGFTDALETAATLLRDPTSDYNRAQARETFKKFTAATGDDAALLAWFDANRGKLTFDPESKKFITKP